MVIKKPADISSSEITPQSLYVNRRKFLVGGAALAGAAFFGGKRLLEMSSPAEVAIAAGTSLSIARKQDYANAEKVTPMKDVTSYNNFYEFGTDKYSPASEAQKMKTRPWTVKVEGLVQKPQTFDIDSIIKMAPLEERIYRHRCVEGWSIVVPWVGFPLNELLKRVQPLGKAKFVELTSLGDPAQMPGVRVPILDWPYTEGFRLDEAMHPLALLTVGMYGEELPKQDGAPVRLVVPWKYGYKSIKSIVRIRLTDTQPQPTWNKAAPEIYGFYSNVNPEVDNDPRYSQSTERRLGEFAKRKTLMFNGYAEQVQSLYAGMDLKKNY